MLLKVSNYINKIHYFFKCNYFFNYHEGNHVDEMTNIYNQITMSEMMLHSFFFFLNIKNVYSVIHSECSRRKVLKYYISRAEYNISTIKLQFNLSVVKLSLHFIMPLFY